MELWGSSSDELTLILFGAKVSSAVMEGDSFRLVTAGFLHIGLLHLIVNAVTLVQLGLLCENLYGSIRFLFLYLVTDSAGFALSSAFSDSLSAGASAALFGLTGALVAFGFRHRHRLPEWLRPQFTWYLLGWIGLFIVFGLVYSGIDNLAHVGGLGAGVVLGLVFDNRLTASKRSFGAESMLFLASASILVGTILQFHRRLEPDLRRWAEADTRRDVKIEILNHQIETHPHSGIYYFLRGEAHAGEGARAPAIRDYEEALALGYGHARLKNALAWQLVTQDHPSRHDVARAIRLAREALRRDRQPAYQNTLGWAYVQHGDYEKGRRMLEEAARLRKESDAVERATDYYMLALAALKAGERNDAAEYLRQADALSSSVTESRDQEDAECGGDLKDGDEAVWRDFFFFKEKAHAALDERRRE